MPLKLNLGAGAHPLEGWVNIDRKSGGECYPITLPVTHTGCEGVRPGGRLDDNCIEAIRASHVLEHWSHRQTADVLREWVRVLKPGGIIQIAVPDLNKILKLDGTAYPIEGYIMGGHCDENDHHGAVFTEPKLRQLMTDAGLVDIQPWQSDINDCAALPISLNLQGRKAEASPASIQDIKVAAILSRPRFGLNDFWDCATTALAPFNIPLRSFKGVFWGQCMQRAFNECVEDGVDWILTLDYDSLFTAQHVSTLLDTLGQHPEIDALAALQQRRGSPFPLMTVGQEQRVECDGNPIKVTTAHFGLTLFRVESLLKCSKPWFKGEPDKSGEWGDDRLDDDIWFWHQWRLAGNSIYVCPQANIGHMEEMVAVYDANMNPRHIYVRDWRKEVGLDKKRKETA